MNLDEDYDLPQKPSEKLRKSSFKKVGEMIIDNKMMNK